MKDTFFFPHDFGARNDPKLQNVLMEHGCEGLGVFWCVVELIYEQGGSLPLSNCKSIAFALHVECSVVESVVNDYALFENDGESFWSVSINNRLNKRAEIAQKRKNAAFNRWNKPQNDANAQNGDANAKHCNAIKEKERKGKENKEDNNESINIDSSENSFSGDSQKSKKEIDYKSIVGLYHSLCPSFPHIIKLSDARKQKIRIRLEEMNNDLELLKKVFTTMENSKFLRGDNKNGWAASFDWIFENSKNWVKVIEGNYSDKPHGGDKSKNVNDIWEK